MPSTSDSSVQPPTTLIIGAGVFGTSTAYHLSRQVPASTITIVDVHPIPFPAASEPDLSDGPPFPPRSRGASHDISKILRADYTSVFYSKLASEALSAWRTWPLLQPCYHPSGRVGLYEDPETVQKLRDNLKAGGIDTSDLVFKDLATKWNGAFKETATEGFRSGYYNPDGGWADADAAVMLMLDDALQRGVKFRQGVVNGLVTQRESHSGKEVNVRGVELEGGEEILADRVILCTGAWTSEILANLEDSLQFDEKYMIESQVCAAGVCVVHFELPEDIAKRFDGVPVLVYGDKGELFPLHGSGLLKVNNAASFTHKAFATGGREISRPVPGSQYNVPAALQKETMEVARGIMPDVVERCEPTFFRLCWDAITPQQHHLITKHPVLDGLFLAVGGSFHSWKFLPTTGKYVTNIVMGVSNGVEKDKNWAWKEHGWGSTQGGGAHEELIPKRDFQSLVDASV